MEAITKARKHERAKGRGWSRRLAAPPAGLLSLLGILGLAALASVGCRGGTWIESAEQVTLADLERIGRDVDAIEYLGADEGFHFFCVLPERYYRVPFAECDPSFNQNNDPTWSRLWEEGIEPGDVRLFVRIVDGRIVPAGAVPRPRGLLADFWLTLLLIAVVAFLAWGAFRPRCALHIVIGRDRAIRHSGIPKGRVGQVLAFLTNDVSLAGKVAILGTRSREGQLRITFRGRVDPGTQQRIRNFLKMVL